MKVCNRINWYIFFPIFKNIKEQLCTMYATTFSFFIFLFSVLWKSNYSLINKRNDVLFINSIGKTDNNIWKKTTAKRNRSRKIFNRLNDEDSINIGDLKVGFITDVKDNNIFVELKNNKQQVVIQKENNYLLENELLYDYLRNSNLISTHLYNKLIQKYKEKGNNQRKKNKKENHSYEESTYEKQKAEKVDDCIVLIKEVNANGTVYGELYTDEIMKRKEKIYEKLNELKTLENKIFIKILKKIKNKYYIVLVNDCIKGYLIYEENVEKEYKEAKEKEERDMKKKKQKYALPPSSSSHSSSPLSSSPSSSPSFGVKKLSAYVVDVNKKLEYVFLSLKKYAPDILANRLSEIQYNIVLENIFNNHFFKGEITDFSSSGNSITVKIFDNQVNSIKVRVKSHNIINTRNMLRNLDYLKHKVITHHFTNYAEEREDTNFASSRKKDEKKKGKKHSINSNDYNDTQSESSHSSKEKLKECENPLQVLKETEEEREKNKETNKKEYKEQFERFKKNYYGCLEADALKYINMESYIFKEEKCIYVRIINKSLDKNIFEGSMKKPEENVKKNIYDTWLQLADESNQIEDYDLKLRYPSTVLGFFNNYVLLRTRVLPVFNPLKTEMENNPLKAEIKNNPLKTEMENKKKETEGKRSENNKKIEEKHEEKEDEQVKKNSSNNSKNKISVPSEFVNTMNEIKEKKPKDVITMIEKHLIDYENLKEGDVFFCRFEKTKNQNIRNLFNLSNAMLKNIYDEYFKVDKKQLRQKNDGKVSEYNQEKEVENISKNKFEEIFFKKKKIYLMRGELHKGIEYRLNKNNIDNTFKKLKYICDTYYSGFNKSYDHYPSIREEFISRYLGIKKYTLYRKIVSDYFSSNKNSYKEFLQSDCKILTRTVFDFVFENPEKLTIEFIRNYNVDVWNKVKQLNVFELESLLNDLQQLKKILYTSPLHMYSQIGRINLLLNHQKPISKDVINNLRISEKENENEKIRKELINVYKYKIIYPISYIKDLLIKKKNAKYGINGELKTVYILAEETINLYKNSSKDVQPFSEEEIDSLKKSILNKHNINLGGMKPGDISENEKGSIVEGTGDTKKTKDEKNTKEINSVLFDPSNSQIRKILQMIKNDLEMQKKKNKLDEVDKDYEEQQKMYTDITKVHKNLHELEEMGNLSKDMFYMKIPFVE